MQKQILVFLFLVLSLNSYSQINFEKGYFIDNNNQKVICLIKNIDWKNNPTEFIYKISETNETKTATLETVKEFGIDNSVKFVRGIVNIDRSSESLMNLSDSKEPKFSEEELFLKVLVEGKSSLYQYIEENLNKYFYKKEDNTIEQLIYKRYNTTNNRIGENNRFRQQLWNNLKCSDFKISKVENLNYKKRDLIKYFTEYNSCNNEEVVNYSKQEKRDLFNLTIRPRLNNSSLEVQDFSIPYGYTDYGSKTGFGLGLELELILPFNKNKWALAVEPTYQSFSAENVTSTDLVSGGEVISKVDYSSIELPVTVRHYFFLSKDSKIFINGSYVIDFNLDSSIELKRSNGSNLRSYDINSAANFAAGIGFKQNDKYSLELRYQTERDVVKNFGFVASTYETISIMFGYSFF